MNEIKVKYVNSVDESRTPGDSPGQTREGLGSNSSIILGVMGGWPTFSEGRNSPRSRLVGGTCFVDVKIPLSFFISHPKTAPKTSIPNMKSLNSSGLRAPSIPAPGGGGGGSSPLPGFRRPERLYGPVHRNVREV